MRSKSQSKEVARNEKNVPFIPTVAVWSFTLSESQPTPVNKSDCNSATENVVLSLGSPTAVKNAAVGLNKYTRRTISI